MPSEEAKLQDVNPGLCDAGFYGVYKLLLKMLIDNWQSFNKSIKILFIN